MLERFFGAKKEVKSTEEQVYEVLTNLLSFMTIARSNAERAVLDSGEQLEADENFKELYRQAKELLKADDLNEDDKKELLETIADVEKEYKGL